VGGGGEYCQDITMQYIQPIMQIVTEARKHFNTMNVEHFYSLYKALMIWKREVCSF